MSSAKKIDLLRDFAAGVYLSEAQKPIPHNPPPLHTVYVYTIYLFTQWRGGGGKPERKGEGQQFTVHKAGSKLPTWLTVTLVLFYNE